MAMGRWNRMARSIDSRFYKTKAWKACRASYIGHRVAIDGGLCEMCKDKLGYIVDHIIELNELNYTDPWIALCHDNLQYLCLDCHNTKTFGTPTRVKFDEEGNVRFITDT